MQLIIALSHTIFTYLSIVFLFPLFVINASAQNNDKTQEIRIIVGDTEVAKDEIKMTKNTFLKPGKIRVNKKGSSVDSYSYSMFSLGSKIRRTVNDSMFSTELRKAVKNNDINYRYINLEGVKIRSRNGNIISPIIDTVKVKFIYP